MFSNLLSSISNSISSLLDKLVFINSDVVNELTNIIGTNSSSGINLICNSLVYGFLIYYAVFYLLSHLTFLQIERPLQFIFKLLLCVIALNSSQLICSAIISLFSHISLFIRELGQELLKTEISFATLIDKINPDGFFLSASFSLFSFDGLIRSLTSLGFINLAISYAIRFVMLKVMVIISPFCILSLCNSKTSWLFKAWIKNFVAMLCLQILIAIILVICFTIDYNDNGLYSQLIHIGMVYALVKSNTFIKELMGGFSTDVSISFPNISSILNTKE